MRLFHSIPPGTPWEICSGFLVYFLLPRRYPHQEQSSSLQLAHSHNPTPLRSLPPASLSCVLYHLWPRLQLRWLSPDSASPALVSSLFPFSDFSPAECSLPIWTHTHQGTRTVAGNAYRNKGLIDHHLAFGARLVSRGREEVRKQERFVLVSHVAGRNPSTWTIMTDPQEMY